MQKEARETDDSKIRHAELSYAFVGCAMQVHREIGPGQDECFYHLALCEALREKGLTCRYKPTGKLVHRGTTADEFEADLIVEDRLVAELKVLESGFAPAHFTQLISYLKFWRKNLGLLVDFGKESLAYKRVPYSERTTRTEPLTNGALLEELRPADRDVAALVRGAVERLANEYGLGYRDTTYTGLFRAELLAEGVPCVVNPTTSLSFGDRTLGTAELDSVLVDGRCVVRIVALYHNVHALHRAAVRAYCKHLGASFGLIVNFGRWGLQTRIVV